VLPSVVGIRRTDVTHGGESGLHGTPRVRGADHGPEIVRELQEAITAETRVAAEVHVHADESRQQRDARQVDVTCAGRDCGILDEILLMRPAVMTMKGCSTALPATTSIMRSALTTTVSAWARVAASGTSRHSNARAERGIRSSRRAIHEGSKLAPYAGTTASTRMIGTAPCRVQSLKYRSARAHRSRRCMRLP
jgi:hypothetical protein